MGILPDVSTHVRPYHEDSLWEHASYVAATTGAIIENRSSAHGRIAAKDLERMGFNGLRIQRLVKFLAERELHLRGSRPRQQRDMSRASLTRR